MFKTIVLALDGSDGAKKAIPGGGRAGGDGEGRPRHRPRHRVHGGKGGELPRVDEDQIRAEIDRQAKELSDRGIETRVELAESVLGGPAHALVELADRVGGDLIVTGTRGHSSIAGLLLGSVTHRLLHIAKRPVLAVPS